MLSQFFQTYPLPMDQMSGTYNTGLVILSYIVAVIASYVALDITNRIKDVSESKISSYLWLVGGSFAMGAGIWSMHFIGMLAFEMPMAMLYDPTLTGVSILVAILASSVAFALLRLKNLKLIYFILGGVVLGFAIAAMHYTGMAAMTVSMNIRYLPGIFALSILIAILASEAALYLALKSVQTDLKHRTLLKVISAFIMGAAICGMHYTGMAAAVFTPLANIPNTAISENPKTLSMMIAIATIFILGIAIILSSFKEMLSAKSVAIARKSGMAEVASSVLHNVGNVLNSVNVSSSLIRQHLKNIDLQKLVNVNQLIELHQDDLANYITADSRGSKLPNYLSLLTKQWQNEYGILNEELSRLEKNIQHISEIIALQQSFSGIKSFREFISIDHLLDEALILVGIDFSKHQIHVEKKCEISKATCVDKLKLTQIIINLICNAKEAALASSNQHKSIFLQAGHEDDDTFFIKIIDNGIGIDESQQSKLFSYGFTTKKTGHGFGLHSSILSVNEMKGTLTAYSEGINKGATFTIKLPYQVVS